jgi:hypothetical protein
VMRIIVNHLTRMQPGYICVAGVDVSSGQHVRPVLRGRLTTDLLTLKGGPFDIASLVELGTVKYCGHAPETEDHYFDPRAARAVRLIPHTLFWELLQHIARNSFAQIFGLALRSFRRGCVVDLEQGRASLGCLIPAVAPRLYVNEHGKTRALITDGTFTLDLSVTDLRLCDTDHRTPKRALVERIDAQMRSGVGVILSVGLARPWRHPDDTAERHWLQVNNIHLEDGAVWLLE